MMNLSSLRHGAFEVARDLSQKRGERLTATFDDSLSGDLARLQVLRRLQRLFPEAPRDAIAELIDEVLTP